VEIAGLCAELGRGDPVPMGAANVGSAAARLGQRMSPQGRVRPVTKGRFRVVHRHGLLCGGELGWASVTTRPTAASWHVERVAAQLT
jgi:hypothetical protein